eukprot:5066460-Pyramimonas_sp.AAC.1
MCIYPSYFGHRGQSVRVRLKGRSGVVYQALRSPADSIIEAVSGSLGIERATVRGRAHDVTHVMSAHHPPNLFRRPGPREAYAGGEARRGFGRVIYKAPQRRSTNAMTRVIAAADTK